MKYSQFMDGIYIVYSCLTTAPHFKSIQDSRSGGMSSRRPLGGHNPPAIADPSPLPSIKPSSSAAATPSSDIEGLETGELFLHLKPVNAGSILTTELVL